MKIFLNFIACQPIVVIELAMWAIERNASMYVCLCKAVSEQKIRKLMEKGALSLQDIQAESKAGTSCGSCLCYIEDIIKEFKTAQREPLEACPRIQVSSS